MANGLNGVTAGQSLTDTTLSLTMCEKFTVFSKFNIGDHLHDKDRVLGPPRWRRERKGGLGLRGHFLIL